MNQQPASSLGVDQGAAVRRAGGLVAFPTETVYGLGADARNVDAVTRIFAVKGRPADYLLIVLLANAGHLAGWAREVREAAWRLAEAFWPRPLTLVLLRLAGAPYAVTGGPDTVVRVPGHPEVLALLAAFGGGIAAPSANRCGRVSPTSAEDVREELGDSVDLALDSGRCPIGIESLIVDLSSTTARILRPGAIAQRALRRILGSPVATTSTTPVRCPGSKPSHNAPRARGILASPDDVEQQAEEWHQRGQRVGVLASRRPTALPENETWLRLTGNVREQARELYHRLRQPDYLALQVLVAVTPPDIGLGHALRDRLQRAAGLGDGAGAQAPPQQMPGGDS